MKIKFAPVDAPRKPVYHDESKKVHVKFDSDDESAEPTPQPVNEPKKRQHTTPDSQTSDVGNNSKKRKAQNGTPIPTPGANNNNPGKRRLDPANTDGSSPAKKPKTANGKKSALTAEQIEEKKRKKREKNKQRKQAKVMINGEKVSVPVLQLQPQTLKKNVAVGDIRNLILYCLAEGTPQPWFKVINKSLIQHLVLVYAPGLDIVDFGIPENRENVPKSVDLQTIDNCLGKATLPFFTSQFSHMMVYKMSGSKGKLTAAVAELMQCNVSHSQRIHREKMMTSRLEKYKNNMREFYVMTLKQLQAAQYPIPPFLDKTVELPKGWKETKPAKKPAEQKRLVALDCEMVLTTSGSALARYTLVDEDNKTLVDEYVKPKDPIIDYKTEFSGITEEIMSKAKCSLRRAQKHFRKYVDHNVILVGHGLENDLKALQIAHPYCVDTSLLYDSHRGPPYRPSLRLLARNILKRNIQRNNETIVGHDSAEDAIASLDLFKLKIQKGPQFGRFGKDTELVFDRLHQFKPSKTGVIMESSPTPNGMYRATLGSRYVHYDSDATLVEQAGPALNEYNFVFTQVHTLDENKSWQADAAPAVVPQDFQEKSDRAARFMAFDSHFKTLYEQAPSGTVFCVLGGIGNVPEYHELYSKYVKSRTPKVEGDAEEQVEWTSADMKKLEHLAAKVRLGAFFCTLKQ